MVPAFVGACMRFAPRRLQFIANGLRDLEALTIVRSIERDDPSNTSTAQEPRMNSLIPTSIKFAIAAAAVAFTALQGAAVDHLAQHQGQASVTPRVQFERVVITASRDAVTPSMASVSAPVLR